jgi:hypothetical protein
VKKNDGFFTSIYDDGKARSALENAIIRARKRDLEGRADA